jgi:hypothetical protein
MIYGTLPCIKCYIRHIVYAYKSICIYGGDCHMAHMHVIHM